MNPLEIQLELFEGFLSGAVDTSRRLRPDIRPWIKSTNYPINSLHDDQQNSNRHKIDK